MWRNSSATKTLVLSNPADELVIRARGGLCNGAPRMQVSVGGAEIINTLVSNTGYTNVSKTGLSLSGSQTIKVSFTNDYYVNSNCDRNLYVDHVYLRSNDSSPPPPPSDGQVLFEDTFDRDADTFVGPWNWMDRAYSDRLNTSNAGPVRAGGYAAKYTVYDGDIAPLTSTENPRAQLNRDNLFCEGDERWIGWSMYFPQSYPNLPSYAWAVHGSIANAPPYGGAVSSMVWSVDNGFSGNRLRLTGRDGGTLWQAPMQRGRWYDWTFHVKFSQNPGVGYLELWRDGNPVTFSNGSTRRYFSTLSPNRQPGSCGNLQVTNYRRHGDFAVVTMYHDEVKVGTSYAAVQPGS